MTTTPCECPMAGYCERHQKRKAGRLYELCRTDMRYYELWERLRNEPPEPRQKKYKRRHRLTTTWVDRLSRYRIESDRGLGDVVERIASKVGGRYLKRAVSALGISCGCKDRQESLNAQYPFR